MSVADIKKNTEQKMIKSIEALKATLAKIRTGRAHPGILEQINVDYYGNPTPLSQVANLGLADARTLTVQPWEKSMIAAVEKVLTPARELVQLHQAEWWTTKDIALHLKVTPKHANDFIVVSKDPGLVA